MERDLLDNPDEWQSLCAALEAEPGSAYVLSPELSILYVNEGWRRYALENGAPELATHWAGLGPIDRYMTAPARQYIRRRLQSVVQSGEPWSQVYECSSPTTYRLLNMRVQPTPRGHGLLVVHSTVVETASTDTAAASAESFSDLRGVIVQCSACGRFRRRGEPATWEWAPGLGFLPEAVARVSHGICPVCDFQYYGARDPLA